MCFARRQRSFSDHQRVLVVCKSMEDVRETAASNQERKGRTQRQQKNAILLLLMCQKGAQIYPHRATITWPIFFDQEKKLLTFRVFAAVMLSPLHCTAALPRKISSSQTGRIFTAWHPFFSLFFKLHCHGCTTCCTFIGKESFWKFSLLVSRNEI